MAQHPVAWACLARGVLYLMKPPPLRGKIPILRGGLENHFVLNDLPAVLGPAGPLHFTIGFDAQLQCMVAGGVKHLLSTWRISLQYLLIQRSVRTADDDARGLAPSDQSILFGRQRAVMGSHQDIDIDGWTCGEGFGTWIFQIPG